MQLDIIFIVAALIIVATIPKGHLWKGFVALGVSTLGLFIGYGGFPQFNI